ncbi:hypothetical protein [Brachybacterium muris]|uniref:Uncharacterized protein n=1 Tax=Brachybacterium muris UCD-AY4 TaxID=1249481 RepID=A0A022KX29_9MICO|nr:hypothetical protein [Brachybacterium muris]EYT48854.1 hypothetical protein D641_0110410 [Brachybacterium muris UCD-AY4]
MSETTRQPISRRTVAKGAAWTAPVILGGIAAPAYAASGSKPIATAGPACKLPGGSCDKDPVNVKWGYLFTFTVSNNDSESVWLYAESGHTPEVNNTMGFDLRYAGGYGSNGTQYSATDNIEIAPNSYVTFTMIIKDNKNSSNASGTITIEFDWGHTADPDGDSDHVDQLVVNVNVPGTNPCVKCQPPA